MQIRITGKLDKEKKAMLREATNFYADLLNLSPTLQRNISLEIQLVSDLLKNSHELGNCSWVDDYVRPREFVIQISTHSPTKRFLLMTLAHEMVHLKQFAKCEMVYFRRDFEKIKFLNKIYDCRKISHWDSPWEIEAEEKEHTMYKTFCKYLRDKEKLCLQ